jgi:signal transduction histidine kinase
MRPFRGKRTPALVLRGYDGVQPSSAEKGCMVTDTFADDRAAVARIDAIPTILQVVCRVTGMGFSAVARVTEDRWIACAVHDEINFGLSPGGELQITTTICNEIRRSGQPVVIDHVAQDEVFRDHPTPCMYGFQSYISVPIRRPGGQFFGTLCAIDPRPARVNTPETIGIFKLFADLIGFHLDAQDRLAASEAALLDARQAAELREQFIAILGHDLRNPLASIDAGARMLRRASLDPKGTSVVEMMQNSIIRMAGIINNVLDLARGRLGGGIPVDCKPGAKLGDALAQVTAELQTAYPQRVIKTDFVFDGPVTCDSARIAQLFSNLLANALTHGDPAGPVSAQARTDGAMFELAVANPGPPIPADAARLLFKPFTRAAGSGGEKGLGLGLYIASEIARAHSGTLLLASTPEETRFTFRMPLAGPRSLG